MRAEDDLAEGLETLNGLIVAHPDDGALLLRRSRLLVRSGRFDQALADLDHAHRLRPIPEIDRKKAEVFLNAGWYQAGIEQVSRHLLRFPEDGEAYLVRARTKLRLGEIAQAGEDFGLGLRYTKDPPLELYMECASALASEGSTRLEQALDVVQQGIRKLGLIVTLESAALEIEAQQKRYDDALKRVDAMLEQSARKDGWLAKRGDILVRAGRIEEARAAYQGSLDAIGKLPPAQRNQPATKDLEVQMRRALTNSADRVSNASTHRNSLLRAALQSQPASIPAATSASTNMPSLPGEGRLRSYFIAAEEIDWHYAPNGNVLQEPFCGDLEAFASKASGRIGHQYRKAVYRGYTDGTFQRLEIQPAHWQHLGLLGPILRAEVGDRIRITFKNRTRFPVSIHPHGVFYLKTSEGSGYNDGTAAGDKKDDMVQPGASVDYEWLVPERAGPGPNDGSSVAWLYHSHVRAVQDSNAGLVGAIIVTAKGLARPDGSPADVDREFVTLFNIFDENLSPYLDANVKARLGASAAVDLKDPAFVESNKMHGINGFIFGNLPLMRMKQGERVRWYLLGMGGETDLHTPHWHGNTVLHHGYRTDVLELLPASMKVADMVADNPGIWMFHCHVDDHMREGMSARYEVSEQPKEKGTVSPAKP
ncbi:MAG: tetratricopeptide repeat protein [Verrucomicrobia bacterium]|nr:tetratricopeptide repeat protein [Verrucomicrobiota bacterium]